MVNLTNPRKEGDSLVSGTPAGAATGQVRAGALEGSGADAARAMVDMIASMRAFEAGQKVIQAIDDTLGRAATQVGSSEGARRFAPPRSEVDAFTTSTRRRQPPSLRPSTRRSVPQADYRACFKA